MFLKSAHIQHFKSLDNVRLEFARPITVLVGPNAVGKSNIVDALRFVRDAVAFDLEHAVSSRGGMARVRQYSKTKPFKMSMRLDMEDEGVHTPQFYEFSIKSETGSNYSVDAEACAYVDTGPMGETSSPAKLVRDRAGSVNVSSGAKSETVIRVPTDQLVLGQLRGLIRAPGWPIERFVRDWRYSALYPNMLREPTSPDRDKVLAENGRNWASVIKAMRRSPRGRAALDRLHEAMRGALPTFDEVIVSTVGSYLVPRFHFKLGQHDSVDFDPVQLSDGTLRIFGILLALYQVPAPKLLVIEEPEQTVHPGVLGVLADAFRECAESTQIIVTTHSPHFIDYFQPEEVRVVTLDRGNTSVSLVRQTQLEAVKRRLMSMQDFMLAEGLMPESA